MSDLNYYIWSYEHNAWWGHNSRGYTTDLKYAGKYAEKDAREICDGANAYCSIGQPNEEMRHANNVKE